MTLAEATEFRTKAKEAYEAAISGKSYTINTGGGSRSITRQDASWLRKELQYWDNEISKINSNQKGISTKFVIYE